MTDLIAVGEVMVSGRMIRVDMIFKRTETDNRPPVTMPFQKERGGKAEARPNFILSEKIRPGDTSVPDKYYQEAFRQAMTIIKGREERYWK